MTTSGIDTMNLPMMPDMNNNGMNAATVVRIVVVTGPINSNAPTVAASFGDRPFSM